MTSLEDLEKERFSTTYLAFSAEARAREAWKRVEEMKAADAKRAAGKKKRSERPKEPRTDLDELKKLYFHAGRYSHGARDKLAESAYKRLTDEGEL